MRSTLTREEVTEIVIERIDNQFPKDCPCCGNRYSSLAEYLRKTSHKGLPLSHDADMGRWRGTQRMHLSTMWRLLQWARIETQKRGLTTSELLESLRAEIDNRVLAGAPVER